MTIAFNKYVDITSGVAGSGVVKARELISRYFTTNSILPTKSILEFTSADQVGDYFGTDSDEYARAAFYFGFISKSITRAQKISFARWTNVDVAPEIFGASASYIYTTFTGINNGAFDFHVTTFSGVTTTHITACDFTSSTSLADVAAEIQTRMRAVGTGFFTSCLVTYNATAKRFQFVGGSTGDTGAISIVSAGSGTDISSLIGWKVGAIYSAGNDLETLTELLTNNNAISDNFASFGFVDILTLNQYIECATWLATTNNKYMLLTADDVNTLNPVDYGLTGFAGVAVTATNSIDTQFPEMIPGILGASTDYTLPNATKNFMFQVFPTVSPLTYQDDYLSTAESNTLDSARINYYAATQNAGQILSFYQRGQLQGGPNDPSDMNVYFNEIWLKSTAEVSIMNAFIALEEISANAEGQTIVKTILQQDVINPALINGVISTGKTLTTDQKLAISEITGDPLAYHQVQSIGYWLDVEIVSYQTLQLTTEYKANYTLVYSKDDVIRKVTGRDVLI